MRQKRGRTSKDRIMEPFLGELAQIKAGNALYRNWQQYALALTAEDVQQIIDLGLTHQANALRSMARELIAGQAVPISLLRKLDLIASGARRKATQIR